MSLITVRRTRVGLSLVVIAAVAALAACAPTREPETSPTPSVTSTPEPQPYSGPVAFVGDELDSLVLTADEIVGLIPDATEVAKPSAVIEMVSDGGGAPAVPSICDALYAEQSLESVGARIVEWSVPTDEEYGFGRLSVLQFADEAHAQNRMNQLLQAAQQCGEFAKEGPATFDAVVLDEVEGVRAFAGTLLDIQASYDWRAFSAFAATGNVIVELWQPFSDDRTFDAEAAAVLLQQRAAEARGALIEDLTANPPVAEEDPASDTSTPWSDWQIGVGGVGPLRLGDPIGTAVSAAGGQVTQPSYASGPWTITNTDGTGSLSVLAVDGGDAVASVTVGNARTNDDSSQDGGALPARSGVRVGAPVADAVAAFPGGTFVHIISASDDYYAVATREGRVFRFQADRDATAEGATIVGITIEDATASPSAVLG